MSQTKPTAADYDKKLKELQELEALIRMKEGLPHLYGYPWYSWALRIFESPRQEILLTAANQIGKMTLLDQDICTPSGFKKMRDIKIGDLVIGDNGEPCRVVDIPFEGYDDGYRIVFDDGTDIVVGANHLWRCKTYKERFRKTYFSRGKLWENPTYGKWIELSTKEIFEKGGYAPSAKPGKRVVIPYVSPVEYAGKDLFDPYALGVIIGDGHIPKSGKITVTKGDDEILQYFVDNFGGMVSSSEKKCDHVSFHADIPSNLRGKRAWEKSIPEAYMTASVSQRLDILRGLMDTDGTVDVAGDTTEFDSTSEILAKQVRELVFSLGGTSKIEHRKNNVYQGGIGRPSWRVRIKMPPGICPFLLKRKAEKWRGDIRYKHERIIYEIYPIGKIKGRCITVNSENSCFVAGRNYVVTHNSSTAIRKNIELATNPSLWPKFWPKLRPGQVPSPFWYMYPTLQVASESVSEKWIKEFLPRNEYKNHPQYGWKEEWHKSEIYAIHFNTGVSIIFKSMSQKVADLQTSSVYHLTCDEELPVELLPELTARTFATSGKMLFVFTATRGDPHWRKAMEPTSSEEETHVDALKIQVSLYDCLKYDDGTDSPWTKDKIARVISSCSSEKEVLRRVYGKFVLAEGLMYEGFTLDKNLSDAHPLPKDWQVFAGVDPGSGGKSGHPAAICFVAVSPTYREARVYRAWRGDGVSTSSQDILDKFRELRGSTTPVAQVYDFAAKDFFLIASRAGEAFSPADKGRERGVALLNTLFKSGMLKIQRGDSELEKLVTEICSLSVNTKKTVAQDDLVDALRYTIMAVPWDFSAMEMTDEQKEKVGIKVEKPRLLTESERRKEWFLSTGENKPETIEDEIDGWNSLF